MFICRTNTVELKSRLLLPRKQGRTFQKSNVQLFNGSYWPSKDNKLSTHSQQYEVIHIGNMDAMTVEANMYFHWNLIRRIAWWFLRLITRDLVFLDLKRHQLLTGLVLYWAAGKLYEA